MIDRELVENVDCCSCVMPLSSLGVNVSCYVTSCAEVFDTP